MLRATEIIIECCGELGIQLIQGGYRVIPTLLILAQHILAMGSAAEPLREFGRFFFKVIGHNASLACKYDRIMKLKPRIG